MQFTTAAFALFAALAMVEPSNGAFIKKIFTGKRDIVFSRIDGTHIWSRDSTLSQSFTACMGHARELLKVTKLGGNNFKLESSDGTFPKPCVVIANSYIKDSKMTDGKLSKSGDNAYILAVNPADQEAFDQLAQLH